MPLLVTTLVPCEVTEPEQVAVFSVIEEAPMVVTVAMVGGKFFRTDMALHTSSVAHKLSLKI
jgi:hypothetical protein